ncbi:AI-2E family transporter [Streptomyces sp. DH37]|uniref:AI-2E family transporter n=1 Tax=Streptomyces sp. DH37 TaxID=3040122 RepID=UPI002441D7E1|nr:AI-2E family transporter [Streptomyces sp. DH37]MDG9702823.1 AI-2E family transporter [Streptomyces sp. DH37]
MAHPSPARRGAPGRVHDRWLRAGVAVWTVLGLSVLLWGLLRVLRPLAPLLWPVIVAAVIVYLLAPPVGLLERRRVPRGLGTALVVTGLIVAVAVPGLLIVPLLLEQVSAVLAGLPTSLEGVERELGVLAERLGLDARVRLDGEAVTRWLRRQENRDSVAGLLSGVGSGAAAVGFGLVLTFAGVVIGFYTLADLPRIRRWAAGLLPEGRREEIIGVAARCAEATGAYLRGQLLVAAFVGVASSLALWAVGLRYWLFVGVVAGVTNLVPFVGPLVGGVLAVAIALLTGDPWQALWAALALTAVQQVESQVVAPLALGRVVRLPPLVVLLVVLAGGVAAGVLGMLVAVPVTTSARIVVRHLRA